MLKKVKYILPLILIILLIAFPALALQLAPEPLFQPVDAAGIPFADGRLFTFESGTSTPLATFDEDGNANKNPVELDSAGRADVYLTENTEYRFVFKDSGGNTIYTRDNVKSIQDVLSADGTFLVEHNSDGTHDVGLTGIEFCFPVAAAADQGVTGAGNTVKACVDAIGATNKGTIYYQHDPDNENTDYRFQTLETITSNITQEFESGARLDPDSGKVVTINGPLDAEIVQIFTGNGTIAGLDLVPVLYFEWWGATADNSTDNTTAMQATIDVADASVGEIEALEGTYKHTGLTITAGILLQGQGNEFTTFDNTHASNNNITLSDSGGRIRHARLWDFKLTHSGGGTTGKGIYSQGVDYLSIKRVEIDGMPFHGIHLDEGANGGHHYAILEQNFVTGNGVGNSGDGLRVDGGTGGANSGQVIGGKYNASGVYGINFNDDGATTQPGDWVITGADMAGNLSYGYRDSGNNNKLIGARFESNDGDGTGKDILLDTGATRAQWFGLAHTSNDTQTQTTFTAASVLIVGQQSNFFDTRQANGFFRYYDVADSDVRLLPKRGVSRLRIPALGLGNDELWSVFRTEDDITITRVSIVVDDTITGANTDFFTLKLVNHGGAPDTLADKAFSLGTDATARTDVILNLTGTASKLNLDQSDILTFQKIETGNGMNMPALVVQIEYEGR